MGLATDEIQISGGLCWPGTFCPVGSGLPLPCTPGYYCEGFGLETPTGLCKEGYYCNGGVATSTPAEQLCTAGHYCPRGSMLPLPCPEGTFSTSRGNINDTVCQHCTPGFICSTKGLDRPNEECPTGYFCMVGTSFVGHLCPPGYYCPSGSPLPLPCEAGSFQPSHGQADCIKCIEGHYCDPSRAASNISNCDNDLALPQVGTISPLLCPVGHFCLPGTETLTQNPCPRGTFSNTTGLCSISQCLLCPPGMYCADVGLAKPSGLCYSAFLALLHLNLVMGFLELLAVEETIAC